MSLQDAGPAVDEAIDRGRRAAEKVGDSVRQFVDDHKNDFDLKQFDIKQFVRDEPWLAVAAAFAVGYVAARLMRKSN